MRVHFVWVLLKILLCRSVVRVYPSFLADAFINNPGEDLTQLLLVKKLSKFKDFGIVVYGRPRSKNYRHASIYRLPFYS